MDKSELSEEEYKERKAAAVEMRNKKNFSNRFVLITNIFLIIGILAIIFILMLPVFAIFSHLDLTSTAIAMLFEVCKMVVFIGSLFLGFWIFRKVVNAIIRKNHLEDRLTEDVKKHYLKKTKEEREMELRR